MLRLLAAGSTTDGIAEELILSPRTVAHQISELLCVTGCSNRAELVARGYVSGCLDPATWPPSVTGRKDLAVDDG